MKNYEVIVIGAGLSGVCAAVKLKQAGIENFRVFEKAEDVGGTWRENDYPGVACDVPSHLYSYSFFPNPDWSKWYGTGQEIWDYIRNTAISFNVHDQIEFNTKIESATWVQDHWVVRTSAGNTISAGAIVAGLGGLHTPNVPALPGMESFQGISFHTTGWRHDVSLAGKRVAVVGTGATAVQFVPEIADEVAELIVFQRSPVWVGPKRDPLYTAEEREEFRRNPAAMRTHRWEMWRNWESTGYDMARAGTHVNVTAEKRARQLIQDSVADPKLAEALTPDYNFSCKRPTLSNHYFSTFNKAHVNLVTGAVEAITSRGVISGGKEYEVDVIIFATGFKPMNITHEIDVFGINGLSLAETWKDRVTSYKSIMVHDFPNFFILMGPNGTGLTSALQMIEQQANYVVDALGRMNREGIAVLNARQKYVDEFTTDIQEMFKTTTHNKGCTSWWSDEAGYNHSIWPDSSITFRMLLSSIDLSEFDIEPASRKLAERLKGVDS